MSCTLKGPTAPNFLTHFQAVEDPRQEGKVLYPLDEILLLVLCGVIAGLGGSKLHIWAFERTKGIHHLMGPKAGDTLRRCRLGILILGHRQCARH